MRQADLQEHVRADWVGVRAAPPLAIPPPRRSPAITSACKTFLGFWSSLASSLLPSPSFPFSLTVPYSGRLGRLRWLATGR